VAYCLSTLRCGGAELNAVRAAKQLDPTRFDIRIFYSRAGPLLSRCSQSGIATIGVPLHTSYGARAVKTDWWFSRLLARQHMDVVHSHDIRMNIFAGIWSRLAGVPLIASRRWWHTREHGRPHRLPNGIADRQATVAAEGRRRR
jgi:hypothetical protein